MISEKTKLTLSIGTVVIILAFIVTSVVEAVTFKNTIETHITSASPAIYELQQQQIRQDLLFMEMDTNIKWIRKHIEDKE